MMIAGLTGSIGMGKSTAADMLRDMQVPVHDSDEAARAMIGPDGPAVAAVAQLFPQAYDRGNNAIDRAILGPIVFADPAKRKMLEDIVHPYVRESQQVFIREQKALGQRLIVLDIPLLYETEAEKRIDKVIVVTCPAFIQRRRVMSRPGMTEEKFQNILASQMPDAEKRRRADFVVQTGLGKAVTCCSLKKIIQELREGKRIFPSCRP
ncbi:MAG TPA: dephospho-CoA kinase [Micavibrio sp.]|jgi:dephospho-CoA kinase